MFTPTHENCILSFHFITEIPNSLHHFWTLSFTAHLPLWVTKELPWIHFYTSIKPGVPFYLRYIESGRFALAGIQWPHHDRRRSDVSLSARNRRLSLFSLLIVECSDAQFTSPHQQVSQRNELQGIESRDWQDSGGGTAGVWGIDCLQVYPVGGICVCCLWGSVCVGLCIYISVWNADTNECVSVCALKAMP